MIDPEAGALEGLARGRDRSKAHDRRVHAGNRGRHDPRKGLGAVECAVRSEEQRRRAVIETARVARGDAACLGRERRCEAGQFFEGRVWARMFVGAHRRAPAGPSGHFDRHDFIVEDAVADGLSRAPLALEREGVLRRSRDPVLAGDLLGRHAERDRPCLGHPGVREAPPDGGVGDRGRPAVPRGPRFEHHVWRAGHALHAAGHEHVAFVRPDSLRGDRDRAKAGSAQPVHRLSRDFPWQPGQQDGHPSNVPVVFASLIRAPENYVVDARGIDRGPFDRGTDGNRREVIGAHIGERSPSPPDGGSDRRQDHRVSHVRRSLRFLLSS